MPISKRQALKKGYVKPSEKVQYWLEYCEKNNTNIAEVHHGVMLPKQALPNPISAATSMLCQWTLDFQPWFDIADMRLIIGEGKVSIKANLCKKNEV